jgi:hypothetical protein
MKDVSFSSGSTRAVLCGSVKRGEQAARRARKLKRMRRCCFWGMEGILRYQGKGARRKKRTAGGKCRIIGASVKEISLEIYRISYWAKSEVSV